MAAGTPIEIRPEYAKYTARADRLPARRLVLVPAALAGDLPHRSRAVRLTASAHRDEPIVARPAIARVAADDAATRVGVTGSSPPPPEALFILSAISQYIGAAIAVSLFDEVEPQTVAWFRVMGRRSRCSRSRPASTAGGHAAHLAGAGDLRHRHGADEPLLLSRHRSHRPRQERGDRVPRTDRGRRRHAPARRATPAPLLLAVAGVITLGGVELADNALGVFFILLSSAMWALYIVVGRGSRRSAAGVAGLGVALAIGTLAITPVGAPTSGPVWSSATLLAPVLPDRRVLERDRLRHRPVRVAPDPGPALLGAARAAAGHGAGRRLGRARPGPSALDLVGMLRRARRRRAAGPRRDRGVAEPS